MGAARIQETRWGVGYTTQGLITTPNSSGELMSFLKNNAKPSDAVYTIEDDANEIGKENEWALNHYGASWDTMAGLEGYLSSEMAAFMFAYGLGDCTPAASGTGYTHTATPLNTPVDGLEPPYLTYVEQIRPPGGGNVIDRAFPGCIVDSFSINVGQGPGRQNYRYQLNLKGTGQIISPSELTIPVLATPHYLPSGSMLLTINGTNYVTSKNIESLAWQYNNNPLLEQGYFPGSGFQTPTDPTSGQLRGRIEVGVRTSTLHFVARFAAGSTELVSLQEGTEGTVSWVQTGALISTGVYHGINVSSTRVFFKDVRVNEVSGIVTVEIEVEFLFPANQVGPLLTAVATNTIGSVGDET
jgi:hypothetical protein